MPERPDVWEIRVGVVATPEQAEDLKNRIQLLLCPDPEHAPPCPIPWSTAVVAATELDDPDRYESLVDQARIEQPDAFRGD